jgi:hypothetical protein
MKKIFYTTVFLFICILNIHAQHLMKTKPQNGFYVDADSSLSDVSITLYKDGCLQRYSHFFANSLLNYGYFSLKKDTFYNIYIDKRGKPFTKETFYVQKDSSLCLPDFSEGTYFSYLRVKEEFNLKGELVEKGIFDIKFRKSMKEYQSTLVLLERYNKKKLTSRRRFTHDEELRSTEIIEK